MSRQEGGDAWSGLRCGGAGVSVAKTLAQECSPSVSKKTCFRTPDSDTGVLESQSVVLTAPTDREPHAHQITAGRMANPGKE
jgi:hypothetical protein